MITFVTLNTIVTDLLNIVRGSQISQSEPISKRQLEGWVHQYRAFLLKRDMDKGKMPNPDYIQEIEGLELSAVDTADGLLTVTADERLMRSDLQLPKTIDLNHKPGFTYVGTVDGHEFMFVSETRQKWQQYKKYTDKEPLVFLKNKYLYLVGGGNLPKFLTVRGVFEVPTEVGNFTNPVTPTSTSGWDDPYPLPINMVPVLKEMILKNELGIMSQAWSDDTNDADSNMEPNVSKGTAAQKQESR